MRQAIWCCDPSPGRGPGPGPGYPSWSLRQTANAALSKPNFIMNSIIISIRAGSRHNACRDGHRCLASAATPADGVERLMTRAMEMGRVEASSASKAEERSRRTSHQGQAGMG